MLKLWKREQESVALWNFTRKPSPTLSVVSVSALQLSPWLDLTLDFFMESWIPEGLFEFYFCLFNFRVQGCFDYLDSVFIQFHQYN